MILREQRRIPVVIVESHQHVLEHIHDVLRKKKLFHHSWSMVHLDAHPDLACTKTAPAAACFSPRQYFTSTKANPTVSDDNEEEGSGSNLYELLDRTSSGIAEWIMPLALAANLSTIEWIKPTFSKQISEGTYRFAVGVDCNNRSDSDAANETHASSLTKDVPVTNFLDLPDTARVKVDFQHPYYLDDQSVVPSEQLVLKKAIELKVSELKETKTNPESIETPKPWILDVCLDYFVCHNPYIADLEVRSPSVTRAFLDVMEESKFGKGGSDQDSTIAANPLDYQTEILRFYKLFKEILLERCDPKDLSERQLTDDIIRFDQFLLYFDNPCWARGLMERLVQEILEFENEQHCSPATILSMVIETIPNWSMPHDRNSAKFVLESLEQVESYLHFQWNPSMDQIPFMITIARSSLDGFCPPEMVEDLQDGLLNLLHRWICGRSCTQNENESSSLQHDDEDVCRLRLVKDYGEWEGSTL